MFIHSGTGKAAKLFRFLDNLDHLVHNRLFVLGPLIDNREPDMLGLAPDPFFGNALIIRDFQEDLPFQWIAKSLPPSFGSPPLDYHFLPFSKAPVAAAWRVCHIHSCSL